MSLFDGTEEFPVKKEIFPDLDVAGTVGQRIRSVVNGVEHNIFNTGTTIGPKVSVELVNGFIKSAAEDIRRIRPDVVIGYGTANLVPLRKLAQSLGAKTVFYLCNPSYDEGRKASFDAVDAFVAPSDAIGQLYKDRDAIQSYHIIRNRVRPYFSPRSLSRDLLLARKKHGFITMINPSLAKGAALALQIANQSKAQFPNLTYLMVESRSGQADIEEYINNANLLQNLWWVQRQRDMKQVYRRTALLLVPSLWFEAAGRVIVEAQLSGIPVLATDSGGIPEQLNGGGYIFPTPELGAAYQQIPEPEIVRPWIDRIGKLITGSDDEYLGECERSLKAAQQLHPSVIDRSIIQLIGSLTQVGA
jgi:glycosyltransferase involved in cell wall biosynthesis